MADDKLIIEIDGDTKEFEKSLSGLEGIAKRSGQVIAGAIAGIGTAFAAAAKSSLGIASNLQEVQNVVDVTFGDGAAQIEEFSEAAGEAFGLSELQAKKYTSTLGAMYKSMGFADDQTLEMSQAMAGLVGDMASFYNLDHDTAFQKIQSGISGEIEPLRQLGINLSVANLEAYAMAEGISTAWAEMTEVEKSTIRYNYILQQTADAQGDFARTSESYANQLRIVATETQTVGATFGEYLLPIATEALGGIREAVQTLGSELKNPEIEQAIKTIGEGISTAINTFISFVTEIIPDILQGFALLIDKLDEIFIAVGTLGGAFLALKAQMVITAAITAFQTLGGAIGIARTAMITLNAVMIANPVGALVAAIGALVGAFATAYISSERFRKSINEVFSVGVDEESLDSLTTYLREVEQRIQDVEEGGLSEGVKAKRLAEYNAQRDKILGQIEALKNSQTAETALSEAEKAADEMKAAGDELGKMGDEIGGAAGNATDEVKKLRDEIKKLQDELAKGDSGVVPFVATQESSLLSGSFSRSGTENAFLQNASEIYNQGEEVAEVFNNGLVDSLTIQQTEIGSSFSEAFRNAMNGEYTGIENFIKDVGENLMSSFADSLMNKGFDLIGNAMNVIGDVIIGSFSNILGIASPSKVFQELGKFTVQGLALGLEGNTQLATAASSGLGASVTNAFSAPLSPTYDFSAMKNNLGTVPASLGLQSAAMGATNVIINNISEVPNTEIQSSVSTNARGETEVTNYIISTVASNVAQRGSIYQAFTQTGNRSPSR